MVLDYCERRPVSKNRPKKQPIGMLVFVFAGAVIISFGSGFGFGWFFGSRPAHDVNLAKTSVTAQKPGESTLPPPQQQAVQDVPLTFYQTLPSGAKTMIGSGLNPGKGNVAPSATPAAEPLAKPVSVPPTAPAPPVPAAEKEKAPEPVPTKVASPGTKVASGSSFCVQFASLRDKKEADATKARLQAKGLAAYIVESNIQDKGTWYRVRIGRHLKQSEAEDLAAKAGNGAIVTPE